MAGSVDVVIVFQLSLSALLVAHGGVAPASRQLSLHIYLLPLRFILLTSVQSETDHREVPSHAELHEAHGPGLYGHHGLRVFLGSGSILWLWNDENVLIWRMICSQTALGFSQENCATVSQSDLVCEDVDH